MKKALLFLLPVLAFISPNLFAQTTTNALFGGMRARQIGPAVMSGRISSIAVEPGKAEVIYVGSASGGLWKSVSGGASFRPIFDDYSQSIGKVAIAPSAPETVWVGTGEPWTRNSISVGTGVYKSTNGGTSWKLMGLENSEHISDIIVHPEQPNTVYVAAQGHLWNANEERGVYKTTDGGENWERVLYIDENTGAADLDIDPDNPEILYAAMWSHRRYPWSFDSGLNGKSGLYKSTDGGKNWKPIQEGLPKEMLGRMAIAVAPSNGQVIYVAVECKSKDGKGLYLSTDQGANWKKVNNDFNTTVRPFYFSNMVVDPLNDSIVMKCGLQAIISEDRGDRFRQIDGTVHSDIHDIWIDPANTKHVLVATDGGMYESFDRGFSFKMWMNLPVSQFYHVSVDNDQPFNVYGGLQDNGSWFAPSRKAGGIGNSDWKNTFGGDGFYSFRHPVEEDVVFCEYQGGNLVRYNKKTGQAKDIQPYPADGEEKFRYNWNAPIHLSPTNPNRMYFGAQYLFVSEDMGDSWKRISSDLTTDDSEKQKQHESGGLSVDNSTAENHCTVYSIAESYQDGQTIWVGTDDGNLQVTMDAGKTWTNVVGNVPDLPLNTWVTFIEPGRFDRNTAFVTFDGHRTGDGKTYLYKTSDGGKSWKNLATAAVEGYALSVRQDPVNPDLLFLGTEFGLYISVDGGSSWARFENNIPKVGVRDMVIQEREGSLVLGTHGRGVIILDDLTPLRQMSEEVAESKVHFFEIQPTVLRDPGAGGSWFGGSGNFVGDNPSSNAQIVYYMGKRHTFGKMYIEVWKDGELLKTLPAGKSAGINIVNMPTALERPKAAPTNNRMALFGSLFGPNLQAGKYDVKLVKGKDTFETTFELINDPDAPYSKEDRVLQRAVTLRLYNMTEQLAYIYEVYSLLENQANALIEKEPRVKKDLKQLAQKVKQEKNTIVSLDGDFYVDEGEMIRERVSNLYRQVSSYPGRPSDSQVKRTDVLDRDVKAVQQRFDVILANDLMEINKKLTKREAKGIEYPTFEAFKADDGGGSGTGGGQLLSKGSELYRVLRCGERMMR
ncbi:MAG: hypothetical protein DHS20C18_42490 [Saprospiraceae bacterium]|nr:MAG: hypothetical protein DHS20C18_42490 [Saprospiraceae bacterium]